MPRVTPLKSSFNGGEIGPLLYGRVESERYRSSLARCKNFLPLIEGPMSRRPGTYFAAEVKDSTKSTRLIEFEFSDEQAYVIETGDQYFRFFRDQGQIIETGVSITDITSANPAVVTATGHGFSNGDEVYIAGVGGMTELNGRNFKVNNATTNTFQLKYMDNSTDVDSTSFGAYTSGGTASRVYEVTSPYLEADLFQMQTAQSADVLYLAHGSYAPRKLSRTAHTSWTLETIDFQDGPYMNVNTTSTTLTPSAATGTGITITASAVTGINNDTGFQSTDVGRLIRMQQGSVWGWVKITAVNSTTEVEADVQSTLTNTSAKTVWRLGLWSDTTGWPSCVTFHEDRLMLGGPDDNPQRMDGSKTGDYENFAPTATDGTIADDNAIGFTFNSKKVNRLQWIETDEKGLVAGTIGGEWIVRPSVNGEALTPTNINAKESTSYGSDKIQPVSVGKSILFVQRSSRKIRELSYAFDVDGFRALDLSVLSRHLMLKGVTQIAYQKEPYSVIYAVRTDGSLITISYERDPEALVVGWAEHVVGGVSDAASTQSKVESVAVIPSSDSTTEEVWLTSQKYIDGRAVRYVEYFAPDFSDDVDQKDAFFVDSGLGYDLPITISGVTQADPGVVTATSHGLSDGDEILVSGVKGMTSLNGNTYVVANSTANTFELTDLSGSDVDTSGFSAYISGGQVRKYVTTLTGLWHLEGQTVQILADGATQESKTVANGAITLAQKATTVAVGLGFTSDAELLPFDAGSAMGTAQGKLRKTNRFGIQFHRSLGLKYGYSFDDLTEMVFKTGDETMDRATPLYTGVRIEETDSDIDFNNKLALRQDAPLPCTVLAVIPHMGVNDR